jgi:DNA-binding HxlR family transcriptional regulator
MYQSNRRVTFAEKQRFTMAKKEKNSIIEICPIRNVVARFGNKWALLVIIILDENSSIRFNQLRKHIPDISTKVLSNTLRILEADGLVKRTVFPEVPVRVEYELTETGRSLVPIVLSLTEWAKNNMKSIMTHRKKFKDSTK